MTTPIRPADDDARALARRLIGDATHAALAVIDPATGHPRAPRVALATAPDGTPLSLISAVALHTGALRANPACPLLACTARLVPNTDAALRARYLRQRPKAKLCKAYEPAPGDLGLS